MNFNKYGAHYWQSGEKAENTSREGDFYHYNAYIGKTSIHVPDGDSAICISGDKRKAEWVKGPANVSGQDMVVVLRGYNCGDKVAMVKQNVNLPYVNGCATRQIFPPERMGDPTFQQLTIPPHTSEQAHHVHATARVVYVLSGSGWSVVGQGDDTEETVLEAGMVCVLDPLCPHHFRTADEYLTVLPVHVFSSPPAAIEQNHPMFNGTMIV